MRELICRTKWGSCVPGKPYKFPSHVARKLSTVPGPHGEPFFEDPEAVLRALTVKELRGQLEELGLPKQGRKADLVARLRRAL